MFSRILLTKHGDTHTVSSGAVCHVCSPRDVEGQGWEMCQCSLSSGTPLVLPVVHVRLLRHVDQLS